MRLTLRALTVVVALWFCACTPVVPTESATPIPSPSVATTVATPAVSTTPAERPVLAPKSAKDLKGLLAGLPGQAGVAIMRPGSPPVVVGTLTTGAAWSTAKVPVAIATTQLAGRSLKRLREQAITFSDNDAATALWRALGKPDAAAGKATAVLRAGGDATTVVNTKRSVGEYSVFGQTQWAISDSAAFAAQLPCLPQAAEVYELMGRISAEQSWGLGRIDGTHFKGGWGPLGPDYLVRQLGVLPLADGQVGVAIITVAPDLQRGIDTLSQIADWLKDHRADIVGGSCRPH